MRKIINQIQFINQSLELQPNNKITNQNLNPKATPLRFDPFHTNQNAQLPFPEAPAASSSPSRHTATPSPAATALFQLHHTISLTSPPVTTSSPLCQATVRCTPIYSPILTTARRSPLLTHCRVPEPLSSGATPHVVFNRQRDLVTGFRLGASDRERGGGSRWRRRRMGV
ncbi:hypothetical protein Droror1_Dr00017464 [Drosera rotundifolia]